MSDPDAGAPIGYLDRWSVPPGGELQPRVFCALPWSMEVVRLWHGDPRPGGPGLVEDRVGRTCGPFPPVTPVVVPGTAVDTGLSRPLAGFAVSAWIRPSLPASRRLQGIFAGDGWLLALDGCGRPMLRLDGVAVVSRSALPADCWTWLEATLAGGEAALHVMDARGRDEEGRTACGRTAFGAPASIGAADAGVDAASRAGFDGVIATPCWATGPLEPAERAAVLQGAAPAAVLGRRLLCAWSFPAGLAARAAVTGDAAHPAVLVNSPATAVAGQHGGLDAARFHADGLTDAGWPPGPSVRLAEDLSSGVYALRLRSAAGVDRVPFVVTPPGTGGRPPVALLLPTMTYLAYANELQPIAGNYLEHLTPDAQPGAGDRWLARHPEFGCSLYDRHADGTGVTHSGLCRPIPNLRPDYLHWLTSEPRHLGADLYLVDFLRRIGVEHDVVCDHDLDEHGASLLRPYRAVVTGSHPEYCTGAMLDALGAHLAAGRRLIYLGGNGFYWVTSTHHDRPAEIEVRRGERGWPWRSRPGEERHGFSGELGGYWEDRGRPPRALTGIRFLGMGRESPAPGYRLAEAARRPENAWLLAGMRHGVEQVGSSGRLMGGAAGHEIDGVLAGEADHARRTVLARSDGHSDGLAVAPELSHTGLRVGPRDVHAAMVLYEPPAGGLVFSTGSICWAGALAAGGDEPAARITENVVRRFSR